MQSFSNRAPDASFKMRAWTLCFWLVALILHAQERAPNIVLIMADDMGYECLGANGSADYRTPRLDALAAEGIRFEHCYSTPLCTPSRVQIMTGKYNYANYVEFGYLDPTEKTFGHLLREAGYRTCVAGKWQLNGLSHPRRFPSAFREDAHYPHKAGFDESCLWQVTQARSKGERFADPLIERNGELLGKLDGEYGPDIFADFICDFIRRNKDEKFFVYYPMVLTHSPFVPTPDSAAWSDPSRRYEKNPRYFKDMVEYTDKIVGRIQGVLEDSGLMENTILLFTGDNGTGRAIKTNMKDGAVIQGGKGGTLDNGTHVPLVACWRGKTKGTVNSDLIDFTDFYVTLAEAAGVSLSGEERSGLHGRSFFPRLLGQPGNPRRFVFCHYTPRWGRFEHTRFARDHRYKLYLDGRLFDVPADKMERSPLDSDSISIQQARASLRKVLDSVPAWDEERDGRD